MERQYFKVPEEFHSQLKKLCKRGKIPEHEIIVIHPHDSAMGPLGICKVRVQPVEDPPDTKAFTDSWIYLYGLAGCCGSAVLTGLRVFGNYRHKGIGTFMVELAEWCAYHLGYTSVIGTDIVQEDDETVMAHILDKRGWQRCGTFKNRRTDNYVSYFIKNLVPR